MVDISSNSNEYVLARRALLDTLFLVRDQIDAFVLVGAQAVYHHAPGGNARPAYTTDADLAIDPDLLTTQPDVGADLKAAGFTLHESGNPGQWITPLGIAVDLMVPHGAIATQSRRSAPLEGQMKNTARRARGLEAALLDNSIVEIGALDPTDARRIEVRVAGPAALVVAKAIKIQERVDSGKDHRVITKDASDVLRLLRNVSPAQVGARLGELRHTDALQQQIDDVVSWVGDQFAGNRSTPLLRLASTDLEGYEPGPQVEQSLRMLGTQMIAAFNSAQG